ncbi:TonB-dependent receptor [Sphingomonas radiodurans]|uniref:TonB-dependent receptor n=1 Tax=Sphingomonas radiodurans TaxID=2890321 RepID=UPI001E2A0ED4|nr:TonB-dependent siderophore receptor [Sphingomonas radiodurans]WBH15614.1 TonB-dependent siderophore receptor [Sphingomonas radiodurans]
MSIVTTPRSTPAFLALAAVGFIATAPAHAAPLANSADPAAADPQQVTTEERRRDDIIVTGQQVKSEQASAKTTRPVRDTPQTVTILTNKTIEQQNLLTLRDVLSTVPGITFGAAEGGVAPSDQITLRGYSASSDITVDNVRDSGQYSRGDPFIIEQVEVVNGANSVYSGSGSVGGSINLVTKMPQAETSVTANAGIGTDDYYRGTIDANVRATDTLALRLNAMVHRNDVPGRDVEYNKRWGVAPSATLGIDGPTRLTVHYFHEEDDNIPQYGVPYYKNAFNNGPVPGVDRSDYFGYRNVDTQDITIDRATIIAEHEFSDRVSIRNLARWQNVQQLTVVGPPQGTFCLPGNVTPAGAACPATTPIGYYSISGPRGNYRDVTNLLMYDQLDLRATVSTGAVEHTIVLGGSYSWEEFTLSTGNVFRNANGTAAFGSFPLINFSNPNEVVPGPAGFTYGSNLYTGPINRIESQRQRGELENWAVYLFDTMKLGKVELNGGVRLERNNGNYQTDALAANTAATATAPQGPIIAGERLTNNATLFSYRVGLVYKPIEAVSLYAAYGNAMTPSQNAVNGACTTATCNVDPETAKSYEIGAKGELFDGRLLLTASAFRNQRDKYRVASNDPMIPDQVLDGASRVDGITLGASGKITSAWEITANYTYLKPELLQSVSDFCLANPSNACGNTAANPDPARGAPLQNTPDHSGSLFTTYRLPFGLTLGYGLTYQGTFAFNLPTAAAPTITRSDDYWVHSAYLSYDFTPNLTAQLNVKNVGDELYYTRIRNNGWATPGDARSAVLTVGYRF